MNKAFIFDMDGVIADSEREWIRIGYNDVLKEYFGDKLWNTVPINSGMSIGSIFDAFVSAGFIGDYDQFYARNIELGKQVYAQVTISDGVEDLIDYLKSQDYKIALVSSSPMNWIDELTARLRNREYFDLKISVDRDPNLRPKPAPDGYLHAIKQLGVVASETFIIEDSQVGVRAGKDSGSQVICYTAYHNGDTPSGADHYVSHMDEVKGILLAKSGLA